MNPLIFKPAELKPTPEAKNPIEALVAEMDSAAVLKAIQVPKATIVSIVEKPLQIRPTSHWGINE